jgi:hypothetical protein
MSGLTLSLKLDPAKRFPDALPHRLIEACGFIPSWLQECHRELQNAETVPTLENVTKFLHGCYLHGGGWDPFGSSSFTLESDGVLRYPEDPPFNPYLRVDIGAVEVFQYSHGIVAVRDGERFEVARMD